jgi:DNA (cytosine-5)-methyltransferase 1
MPFTVPCTEDGNMSLLPEGPSCKDALGDLPEAEHYEELTGGDAIYTEEWRQPSEYAKELRCLARDSWHYGHKRRWEPNYLTASARTKHTAISRRRFSDTNPGEVEPISRFFKLASGGVSNTLRAGTDSARGAFTSPRPIHYEKNRCITVREMARLHGFPDWFRFHKTKWHGARQIGNAVPPPLARALALEFMSSMGIEPTKPCRSINLGDPMLLSLDMTAAASFWDIEIPISRRNRKSRFKKRKQEDIEAQLSSQKAMIEHG